MRLKRKLLFVINPKSGSKNKDNFDDLINKYLDHTIFDYHVYWWSEQPKLQTDLIELGYSEYDALIAVGGDGTINSLINAVDCTGLILGLIPFGSGNGLARELQLSLSPPKAIQQLNRWNFKPIDVCSVNGKYFLNVAGIGFDAAIGFEFAKSKVRGLRGYVYGVVKKFFSYSEQEYSLKTNDDAHSGRYFIISFANGRQWGNEFYVAKDASIDDGKIDLTLIRKPKLYQIPSLIWALRTQKKHSLVRFIRSKRFVLNGQGVTQIHIDGEPVESEYDLEVICLKHHLKFLV